MRKRAIIIVLDGVGIGELPDAATYGDNGANTLKNITEKVNNLRLPNLEKAGLGNIIPFSTISSVNEPQAAYGKMTEIALDKDSTSGHWEIAGLRVEQKFPSYPQGFPASIIDCFTSLACVPGILCNQAYSGTKAIEDFGEEHMRTRKPIIYTSADSVFQIAAHEEIYSLDELYKMCEIARYQVFNDKMNIGRVIARPFIGANRDNFERTTNRKDYSITPPRDTILDILKAAHFDVIGIGKIEDLFNFKGLTKSEHSRTNKEGIDTLIKFLTEDNSGLIFTNLVDFDTLWGHRNLPQEFANGLQEFDKRLPEILNHLADNDLLFITADHGCDPTTESTDHSREYVPLLVFGNKIIPKNLGIRSTFSDVAATIADYFQVNAPENGTSFLTDIL
jgi:phosphopentomutase